MTASRCAIHLCVWVGLAAAAIAAPPAEKQPAWATAHRGKPPLTAAETKAFMRRLARYVFDHHLKKDPKSPQRGMVYEFFNVPRKGKFDQWIQGESLDTMHDGAWFAAAMVNAWRTTGEAFYKDVLTKWQLPFYLRMLNHSDTLFASSAKRNDARKGAIPWGRAWAFQDGEKGFIPYFWDDGASVSLERRGDRNLLGIRPCADRLAGKPNPRWLLDGYSQGMSNHMAQDIGVMVQLAWLAMKDSADPADKKLAAELAEAARNLHECRVRHFGFIPMCAAAAALSAGDGALMKRVPDPNDGRRLSPGRHYTNALADFEPGKRYSSPGFADDQQYRYYHGIARTGGKIPRPLAFKIVCDAYTEAMLYRHYSDDAPVPAGINRFDLYPQYFVDGKPQHYRSDRKGPGGRPVPVGSRMGPQNMICSGWALQVLRAFPGIWEERYKRQFAKDLRVYIFAPPMELTDEGTMEFVGRHKLPFASLKLGGMALGLVSMPRCLMVVGHCDGGEAKVEVFSRPDAKGGHATITAKKAGTLAAVNHNGSALIVVGKVQSDKGGFLFTATIPYTEDKDQKPWINGIEHGRYSIRVGKETRNFYLASSEEHVRACVEHELAGGLRTWEAIFEEFGYIPTGIGTGRFWDGFSDSGGYAHLISAAAQWLLCLEKKSDWDMHDIPRVLGGK